MKPPKTVHVLQTPSLAWVDVTRVTEEEMMYLEKIYGFHPLDLKECLPPLQRPKLVPRGEYLFLVLNFPLYNRKTRQIEPQEVDLFILKNLVVTVHASPNQELQNFFELLELNKKHRETIMRDPAYFLTQLLDETLDACFPMLLHISNDIEELQKRVLKDSDKTTIHDILRLKNNIVSFKKAMHSHYYLYNRLEHMTPMLFPIEAHRHYFRRLTDHAQEIWDNLGTYSYAMDSVQQTYTTLISFRLNEIMRTLTVFSIVIFTLTLIATLFGIDADDTPFIYEPWGFRIILGILAGVTILGIAIFKKKRWL